MHKSHAQFSAVGKAPAVPRVLNVPAALEMPALLADPASAEVREMLERLAPMDATLLISGETGTGKEMAARYLHANSRRRNGPFLAVNCGALSETLAEAELFGHEKGAFAGAIQAQRGWFEAAQGGTLLLDEVASLTLPLQAKLLRVLQEHQVLRLGSHTPVPVNVRVIAATNINLQHAIAEKKFREDLYFRLNVACIDLLPLRQRRESIPALAEHFLRLYRGRHGRPMMALSQAALQTLASHTWPGNIRELENTIHNAVLLTPRDMIEASDLRLAVFARSDAPAPASLEDTLAAVFARALAAGEADLLQRVTTQLVQSAYAAAAGNQVQTATALGISRNSLRTQLANLGAIPPRRRNGDLPALPLPELQSA